MKPLFLKKKKSTSGISSNRFAAALEKRLYLICHYLALVFTLQLFQGWQILCVLQRTRSRCKEQSNLIVLKGLSTFPCSQAAWQVTNSFPLCSYHETHCKPNSLLGYIGTTPLVSVEPYQTYRRKEFCPASHFRCIAGLRAASKEMLSNLRLTQASLKHTH